MNTLILQNSGFSVLKFDGNAYLQSSEYSTTLYGTLDLEFNLWLDKDSGYSGYHNLL